jgi:hypothetical protein
MDKSVLDYEIQKQIQSFNSSFGEETHFANGRKFGRATLKHHDHYIQYKITDRVLMFSFGVNLSQYKQLMAISEDTTFYYYKYKLTNITTLSLTPYTKYFIFDISCFQTSTNILCVKDSKQTASFWSSRLSMTIFAYPVSLNLKRTCDRRHFLGGGEVGGLDQVIGWLFS